VDAPVATCVFLHGFGDLDETGFRAVSEAIVEFVQGGWPRCRGLKRVCRGSLGR
jgi:hypothetical protein